MTKRNLLSEKAILASLTIGGWSARKYDERVTRETNQRNNAKDDAGRYNKLLVAKEEIQKIQQIMGKARTASYELTMPWLDDGARILPSAMYDKYTKALRELRIEYETAVKKFADGYPQMVEDAKQRLNGMFNQDDYPPAGEMSMFNYKTNPFGRFRFDVVLMPCPDAADFRVDLADEHADAIRDDIESRMNEALQNAMAGPIQRVINVCGAMVDRLTAYRPAKPGSGKRAEGTFRDSLVDNIRELVEVLPAFNLSGDIVLANITDRLRNELCKNSAETLRQDAKVREATKKAAKAILADAEAMLG